MHHVATPCVTPGPVPPREQVDGWDLLGVEYVDGRAADYRPGSPDLPAVVDVMRRLGGVECPDLPELKSPAQRWRKFVDDPSSSTR